MDSLRNMVEPIRTMQIRPVLAQIITLGEPEDEAYSTHSAVL
jgi:hypothetical protein